MSHSQKMHPKKSIIASYLQNIVTYFKSYVEKIKKNPKTQKAWSIWWKSTVAMSVLSMVHAFLCVSDMTPLLIGSFGASAVLLFATPQSPLAQPRNVLGGHLISALVGVTIGIVTGENVALGASLAVSSAIAMMYITDTLHPPGGATALIAIIGGEGIRGLGYGYALMPTGLGALILVIMTWLLSRGAGNDSWPTKK